LRGEGFVVALEVEGLWIKLAKELACLIDARVLMDVRRAGVL